MTVRHDSVSDRPRGVQSGGRLETVEGWFLGVVGVVAAFLGVFILVAGEEQSVGIGGELSWKVGEIPAAWPYGLLFSSAVLLILAVWLYRRGVVAVRAGGRATPRAVIDLVLHANAFVVVNAFLWLQDIATGGGVDYAYWVTVPWGIGLAIHCWYALGARRQQAA
jgi:hypothetical protein